MKANQRSLVRMTTAEYEAHPGCYRSIWSCERTDWTDWENIRHKYMGKRTLMKEGALWVEGISFEIDDTIASEKARAKAQADIDRLILEIGRASDLVGYGVQEAGKMLCDNWIAALRDGCTHNLVEDVDSLIARLEIFRGKARAVLPVANGGFGGHSKSLLLEKLMEVGVEIYDTGDDKSFGFTGCEVNEFDSFDEALNAALQARPEIVTELENKQST